MSHDLIGLLVLWHRCEQSGALRALGLPAECPSTAGYRTSRQYDDANGAAETDARGQLAKAVGQVVSSIHEPYRTALHVVARNHATGIQVWASPRLPEDGSALADVVSEALALFQERL
jgi:hypothetical protein